MCIMSNIAWAVFVETLCTHVKFVVCLSHVKLIFYFRVTFVIRSKTAGINTCASSLRDELICSKQWVLLRFLHSIRAWIGIDLQPLATPHSFSTRSRSGGRCSQCCARYQTKLGVSIRTMSKAAHSSVVPTSFFQALFTCRSLHKVKFSLSDESKAKFGKTLTHHSEGATTSLPQRLFFPQKHLELAWFYQRRGTQSPWSITRCLAWVSLLVSTTIKITILSTLSLLVSYPLPSLSLKDKGLCVQEGVLKPYAHKWSLLLIYLKLNWSFTLGLPSLLGQRLLVLILVLPLSEMNWFVLSSEFYLGFYNI